MAKAVLGCDTLDIHTGGEDNIFPHHECEIAQSTATTGKPLARFWLHTRFLLVEGQKMSKSKGNFYTVRDLIQGHTTGRPVDPSVIRFELIKAHYRSNANFTQKGLEDSAHAVQRLRHAYRRWREDDTSPVDGTDPNQNVDLSTPVLKQFTDALADDLNISAALGVLFGWLKGPHRRPIASLSALEKMNTVLGLSLQASPDENQPDDATRVCRAIDAARTRQDYAEADQLRQQLIDAGYDVQTTPQGTTAHRRLA